MSAGPVRDDDGFRFQVKVDYQLTVEEMIALGGYDSVKPLITQEYFPHDQSLGEIEITAKLIHFGRGMCMGSVLSHLKYKVLRPATMAELLAFGTAFPAEQLRLSIIALGSIWRGPSDTYVGCLTSNKSKRELVASVISFMLTVGAKWGGGSSFLAVPIGQVPQVDAEWERTKLYYP